MKFRLITLFMGLLLATQVWTQDVRLRIAVVGLSNPSTLGKSNIGNALVDILDSEISQAGKYTLLERAELEELKKELNLGGSDLADPKSFAEKGGLAGADFLLLGKVSDYTYKENISKKLELVPGSGFQEVLIYEHVGEVRVDIRLVDMRTGEAVRSAAGRGTGRNSSYVSFQAEWHNFVATQGQATLSNLNTLLTDASHSAIRDAVRKLNDMYAELSAFRSSRSLSGDLSKIGGGKILADIGQGQYIIGVQTTSGLKLGDRFRVISEVPIKNSKGVVVYSEKHDVAAVEVVDISQTDKARVRLITPASGTPMGSLPKENDSIAFDQEHGKTLRGGGDPRSIRDVQPSSTISTDTTSAKVGAYIEKGDRFLYEKEYSEALTQYKKGLQLEPNNPELLSRKAIAEAGVSNYTDAGEDAEKAIAAGGSLRFPIVHNHLAGYCSGSLIIERGKVTFQPQSGDHGFSVTSSGQIDLTESTFTKTNLPEFLVHWRSQDGKDHKYYIVVTTYLTRRGGSSTIAGTFQADGDAVDKTAGLDRMILRLIKKSLP
jgi:curli biogenesis system outer membrane secretion channel CsgG